jgi:hypothetical protein
MMHDDFSGGMDRINGRIRDYFNSIRMHNYTWLGLF